MSDCSTSWQHRLRSSSSSWWEIKVHKVKLDMWWVKPWASEPRWGVPPNLVVSSWSTHWGSCKLYVGMNRSCRGNYLRRTAVQREVMFEYHALAFSGSLACKTRWYSLYQHNITYGMRWLRHANWYWYVQQLIGFDYTNNYNICSQHTVAMEWLISNTLTTSQVVNWRLSSQQNERFS